MNDNNCVCCGRDTSFGSGLFVNRLSADADYESYFEGKKVFDDGEYRSGYLCSKCSMLECDRCDELITLDEDITASQVLGYDNADHFTDGAYRVHEKCLTKNERKLYEQTLEVDCLGSIFANKDRDKPPFF